MTAAEILNTEATQTNLNYDNSLYDQTTENVFLVLSNMLFTLSLR